MAGALDSSKELFAEQFEESPTGILYRKYQKGEAYLLSEEERAAFLKEFERNLTFGFWGFLTAILLPACGMIFYSAYTDDRFSQPLFYIVMGAATAAYLLYHRWAWDAPSRHLAGRTPVAGER